MTAMTNAAVPVSDGASAIWTVIYTAAGSVTLSLHNRSENVDLLIRCNGASGAANDAKDSPAEILLPRATMAITLATGDKVLAKPLRDDMAGRVTLRV